jgi:hypothetical protein
MSAESYIRSLFRGTRFVSRVHWDGPLYVTSPQTASCSWAGQLYTLFINFSRTHDPFITRGVLCFRPGWFQISSWPLLRGVGNRLSYTPYRQDRFRGPPGFLSNGYQGPITSVHYTLIPFLLLFLLTCLFVIIRALFTQFLRFQSSISRQLSLKVGITSYAPFPCCHLSLSESYYLQAVITCSPVFWTACCLHV